MGGVVKTNFYTGLKNCIFTSKNEIFLIELLKSTLPESKMSIMLMPWILLRKSIQIKLTTLTDASRR